MCLPFNIGCGFCESCEKGLSGFCLTTNPGTAGAAYGFAGMPRPPPPAVALINTG